MDWVKTANSDDDSREKDFTFDVDFNAPVSPVSMLATEGIEMRGKEDLEDEEANGVEADEDLSRKYCVYRTLVEMLRDRGFMINEYVDMRDFANRSDRMVSALRQGVYHNALRGQRMRVIWDEAFDGSPAEVNRVVGYLKNLDGPVITNCLLVTKHKVSLCVSSSIGAATRIRIEHWLADELVSNAARSQDLPFVEVMTDWDTNSWLRASTGFRRRPHLLASLPTLSARTALARYYGLAPHDLVRCWYPICGPLHSFSRYSVVTYELADK